MHEPYRTLLGHLRHESGHYYWDRLVAGTPWHERFRFRFPEIRSLERDGTLIEQRKHFAVAHARAVSLRRRRGH